MMEQRQSLGTTLRRLGYRLTIVLPVVQLGFVPLALVFGLWGPFIAIPAIIPFASMPLWLSQSLLVLFAPGCYTRRERNFSLWIGGLMLLEVFVFFHLLTMDGIC